MAAARTGSTKARFVNERQLFHGTNPEIVEAICKQNFDWRLHGKNATVYGEGSYFALKSSYSDRYAKEDSKGSKFMFVAKVLVGSYTKGQSSYRRPPSKEPSNPASDLYDSCVDDRSFPTIFVVFDTDQFYPEYIIEYSTTRDDHQQPAGPGFTSASSYYQYPPSASTTTSYAYSGASGNQQPAGPVARAPAPGPRPLPAAMGVAATAHYNASSLSTSYQATTSSSVLSPVQAPYSSSFLSLGGYTSTSSTTSNPSSANYYHLPIAGENSASSYYQYPPTASTTTSYAYSGASGNQSFSPSSSWSSSPAYKPQQPRDTFIDKCEFFFFFFCISMSFFIGIYAIFLGFTR